MKDLVKNIQLILLAVILICTVLAVLLEIRNMFINQTVTLADLLLMFLYLEVLAMVRVFWDEQSISITLPLLIAITALSRFIILQGKEMDASQLLYESLAIVFIAIAIAMNTIAKDSYKSCEASISLPCKIINLDKAVIAIKRGKVILIDCSSQKTRTIAKTSRYKNIRSKSANVTV